jgi:predicted flap endonuclease-1-like 5' DNA nuclease
VARLFLAGLISGLVWESMNFAAPQKWIYTVRGLEDLKLFEMPLLGFLGFPALAFDAVSFFSLMSYFLCGNIAWEHKNDLAAPSVPIPNPSSKRFWQTLPLQVAFCIAVTIALMPISIGSIRLRLWRVPTVAEDVASLEETGIEWPRQLLRALDDPDRREQLAKQLDWTEQQVADVEDELALYLFKGIGSYHGHLLQEAGIREIEGLAAWEPVALQLELERIADGMGGRSPRLDWVRVWVLASRSRGLVVNAL